MTVLVRFERAFARLAGDIGDAELLPARLATACTEVLPIAGAGISLFMPDGFRVPIGASDEQAARAERLQFTLGAGPCIEAHATGRVVRFTIDGMARRWPDYARALATATPFRAILAAPLSVGMDALGTTDLFLDDPRQLDHLDVDEVAVITEAVSQRLSASQPTRADEVEPAWLTSPSAERRNVVFIAMGMASVDLDVTAQGALTLLRARAVRDGISVDDLALEIVGRRLRAADLPDA